MSDNAVPEVGQPAPTFHSQASTGEISLDDFKGKMPVVLYFYPRADTPGCTKESCAFRDLSAEFKKRGVAVLGVSADTVDAQQKFDEKYHLGFPLIADTDHTIVNAYGVWGERVGGGGVTTMGIRRWTFLIDKTGTIRKVYQKVTPETHADEILHDVESLGLANAASG